VLDDARLETGQGQLLARGRLGEADGLHAIRLRHAEMPLRGTAPAAAAAPAIDVANAGPRATGIDGLPPLAGFDMPLGDINSPDAFRDMQGIGAGQGKGNLRG
jgi:flagellar motor switch protein FliM